MFWEDANLHDLQLIQFRLTLFTIPVVQHYAAISATVSERKLLPLSAEVPAFKTINKTRTLGERTPSSAKANVVQMIGVRIRSLDDFQNLMGSSLSKNTFVVKFSSRSDEVSRDMSQIVEKCPISQCWRCLKKFLDPDPEAEDFQNLIRSSLSIVTSVVNFLWSSVQ